MARKRQRPRRRVGHNLGSLDPKKEYKEKNTIKIDYSKYKNKKDNIFYRFQPKGIGKEGFYEATTFKDDFGQTEDEGGVYAYTIENDLPEPGFFDGTNEIVIFTGEDSRKYIVDGNYVYPDNIIEIIPAENKGFKKWENYQENILDKIGYYG